VGPAGTEDIGEPAGSGFPALDGQGAGIEHALAGGIGEPVGRHAGLNGERKDGVGIDLVDAAHDELAEGDPVAEKIDTGGDIDLVQRNDALGAVGAGGDDGAAKLAEAGRDVGLSLGDERKNNGLGEEFEAAGKQLRQMTIGRKP